MGRILPCKNMETEGTTGAEAQRREGKSSVLEGELKSSTGAGSHQTCRPLEGI